MADESPAPRSPAAANTPVFVFPTPDKRDLLFYIEVQGKAPINSQWAYGDAYKGSFASNYPDHVLVYVSPANEKGWVRWYYAAPRSDQDNYNFEFASADMGGRRFDVVNRTYVSLRTAFNASTPTAGEVMPITPGTKFQGLGYVLMGRTEERIGEPELDSLFVVERFTYVKKSSITRIAVDPLNGETLTTTSTFYYASEANVGGSGLTAAALFAAPTNAYWGLQADGHQRSGQQLSSTWYVIDDEQVIGGTFGGGELTVASFTSNENYYWPPVLSEIEFMDWARRDGGEDIFPRILFDPEGYNGPCLATTTVKWKATPFTITQVDTMQPMRIYYGAPFFTLNIPECLHGNVDIQCDIGTGDPEYSVNSGSTRTFLATSPPGRPLSVTAYDDQKPFRGGFLRTTVVIEAP